MASLSYDLNISSMVNSQIVRSNLANIDVSNKISKGNFIIENIALLGDITTVELTLKGKEKVEDVPLTLNQSIEVSNLSDEIPEIVLTNRVPYLIHYNNVYFTWIGYYQGKFKAEIEYQYNFDGKGWSVPNREWRKIELYNLKEGSHTLLIKALYANKVSREEKVEFFVDINKPQFDTSKIKINKLYNSYGIPYEVTIIGERGAISDASLKKLKVNNEDVKLNKSNEQTMFIINKKLVIDGLNQFVLTAYDDADNFTKETITIDNSITEILYPKFNKNVKYAPMTVVGKLKTSINSALDIYLFDVKSLDKGLNDFSGWKKAKINHDKTFFIEDVYVNPGVTERESYTPLYLACVFKTGETFYKIIDVHTNEMIMPIDMSLSTHSSQGETSETKVEINCKANVDNISSWSIDFEGDGIYDMVDVIDNPSLNKEHKWSHSYSNIGIVKPRVRVITNDLTSDCNYFSVSDEIFIHESIMKSVNVIIPNPISLSSIPYEGAHRIFVLSGVDGDYNVEVYKVEKNNDTISNRLFNISLKGYGLENPVKIKALDNNTFYIADNYFNTGRVFLFKANNFGNYLPVNDKIIEVDNKIYGMDIDKMSSEIIRNLLI